MPIIEQFRERKAVVIITGVVLVVALGSIWLRLGHSDLKLNHAEFRGIGQVLAEETSRAVHDKGSVVAVINASYEVAGTTQFDNWQAFSNELKKHPSLRLVATEHVEADPADGSGPTGCPSGAFKDLLERYVSADAIVFFISLPDWVWIKQNNLIPEHRPEQIIVVDLAPTSAGLYQNYFANGFLSVLIGPRRDPLSAQPANRPTPREWFDKYFQVFTPQNYQTAAE